MITVNMFKRRVFAGLAAGVVLAAVGLGSAGAAFAYPVGTAMTVKPTETSGPSPAVVVAHVGHVTPQCEVDAKAKSGSQTATTSGVADSNGSVSLTLNLASAYSMIYVSAWTVNCAESESASASLKPLLQKVAAPKCVAPGQKFTVNGIRFPANTAITFKAKLGSKTVTKSGTTNANGAASVTMKLPTEATWVITGTAGGHSSSTKVIVLK